MAQKHKNIQQTTETENAFEDRILNLRRVSKKTTGGNKISFSALVLVGDKMGTVGIGSAKASDVSSAIKKAAVQARKASVKIKRKGDTIAHEIRNKYKSTKVLIKPAPKGSGVIAGGALRDVVELAGIRDVSGKLIGSTNKATVAICAIEALSKVKE